MHLTKLITNLTSHFGTTLNVVSKASTTDIEITGLSTHSKNIKPGYLFAAYDGIHHKAGDYIDEAISLGASVLLVPETFDETALTRFQGIILKSLCPRKSFAQLSALFYGQQPEYIVAVTGTNGKTSTARFCQHLWAAIKQKSASLGTLGLHTSEQQFTLSEEGPHLTTPDASELHRQLKHMKSFGIDYLAIEASSHGLDQHRIDGIQLHAGAFTNLSRDHLDYHETMEAYFKAKQRLFQECIKPDGWAILNADIPEFEVLHTIAKERKLNIIRYGHQGVEVKLHHITPQQTGQDIALEVYGKTYQVHIPLLGAFQVMNALCALSLTLSTNQTKQDVLVKGLASLPIVHGRLEPVTSYNGAHIFIDYAHTPDALTTVLTCLKAHTPKKLRLVFGCGGNRDQGKRAMMGEIAGEYADQVIITDDNPRFEKAADIRKSILAGCPQAKEIEGRAQAIEQAIRALKPQDSLLIAGKGHEPGQEISGKVYPFDDKQEILKAVQALTTPIDTQEPVTRRQHS